MGLIHFNETLSRNALGEVKSKQDRNGSTHTFSYDIVGRMTADAVTTLGAGVDGTIKRLETKYDSAGRPYLFTSFDADTAGNVVNEVKRDYNGLGQLTSEWQAHNGAVDGSSLRVQYNWSFVTGGTTNHSRLTTMIYPNGRALGFNYGAVGGLNDRISRLERLRLSVLMWYAKYSHLGLDTVVERTHRLTGGAGTLDLT